ncbi:Transcriptional activator NprA [Paraliobacillus sp. PM-2]|uniref:helix-turn-helix transcriptional regulator n=1 Tax=Paraliobacillus sp. PM-2 TaxID=1462524 RepID=UPI00061BD90B|nr:helix-turn-helix transcriptional regulator [Paraliobacillus sp. PM-2]CQR46082.1 Transcriptional activator NprA [Paraliobacillus sp. PM-2]
MSTGIGNKIKYYRVKAKMTQEELASGVVSVSYLSKIEHDSAEANPEAIQKLCEKLNINPVRMRDDAIQHLSDQWHKELLQQDIAKAKDTYLLLKEEMEKIIDAELYWVTELHRLYYYVLSKQYEKAIEMCCFLEQHQEKFNELEQYYWYKFSGYYYYIVDLSYLKAYGQLRRAEEVINVEIANYNEEIHDLYFLIANVSTKVYFTYHTMVYIEKALEFYRNNYQLKRCAECQIIKGIAYTRMNEMAKAKKSFHLAFSILNKYNNNAVLASCNRELGDLYNRNGEPTKAVTYFEKAYQIAKDKEQVEQLKAMLCLVKIYVDRKELEQAKQWYEEAMSFLQIAKDLPINYVYELKTYYYLIYGFDQTFEVLMEKTVLPFLKQKEQCKQYSRYKLLLGDYYYENRKYKLAASCYKKAHESVNHIQIKDNL